MSRDGDSGATKVPSVLLAPSPARALRVFQADAETCAAAALGWQAAGLAVRAVRGRKMRTVAALFDEMAAALQFPHYFGENWPAYSECLSDLDELARPGLVVVVYSAAEVLADAPAVELTVLTGILGSACETYGAPIADGEWWDRPAVPFHVVLQVTATEAAAASARWRSAGADLRALADPA